MKRFSLAQPFVDYFCLFMYVQHGVSANGEERRQEDGWIGMVWNMWGYAGNTWMLTLDVTFFSFPLLSFPFSFILLQQPHRHEFFYFAAIIRSYPGGRLRCERLDRME